MIYITGDCNGDFSRFSLTNFPMQKQMTKNDFVIICGNFGYWDHSDLQEKNLEWLSKRNFTTLFIDGCQENFDMLNEIPETKKFGGKVHEVAPSVYHLCRGYIFSINGKKIFTFGGSQSNDIKDGIIGKDSVELIPNWMEEVEKYKKENKTKYRVNHLSWWKEELPNPVEKTRGINNFSKARNKVDYIITHDCPATLLKKYCGNKIAPSDMNKYLEIFYLKGNYQKWFFGKYGKDIRLTEKDIMVTKKIIKIV